MNIGTWKLMNYAVNEILHHLQQTTTSVCVSLSVRLSVCLSVWCRRVLCRYSRCQLLITCRLLSRHSLAVDTLASAVLHLHQVG